MKRREFFKLMGIASGAALTACSNDADKTILPYLVPPEDDIIPGVPRYVHSTCTECPANCGITVKVLDDRPVKLEGNKDHPINQGALCVRGQASLARLYHPHRLDAPLMKDKSGSLKPVTWDVALKVLSEKLAVQLPGNSKNVYLSSYTSGSMAMLMDEFCIGMKVERAAEVEILHNGAIKEANNALFQKQMVPGYRIDRSDALLTVGADIFETFISPVEFARQYRQAKQNNRIRWFHVEPYITTTGASADSRSVAKPGSESHLLAYLLHNITHRNNIPADMMAKVPKNSIEKVVELTGLTKGAVLHMVQGLNVAKNPLIITGGPALATANGQVTAQYTALLQWALAMVGEKGTVDFSRSVNDKHVGSLAQLTELAKTFAAGSVNIAFFSKLHGLTLMPEIMKSLSKAKFKVAFSQMNDAVTKICDLVLPIANPLESWGDAEPKLGIKSVIQPVLENKNGIKSEGDLLLKLMGQKKTYRDFLSTKWQGIGEELIDKGFKFQQQETVTTQLIGTEVGNPVGQYNGDCLYIVPSLRTYDGRSADISLLHEIPDPLSAVSYGKYIAISLSEAKKTNAVPGDMVTLKVAGGSFSLPITINPGLPAGVVTLSIDAVEGFNFPVDKANGQPHLCFDKVTLKPTGKKAPLALLSGGMETGKRGILPDAPIEHHGPHGTAHGDGHNDGHEQTVAQKKMAEHQKKNGLPTLYEPHDHKDYRWGMVIDLDACTGCSACVAACYVENNVPVVGPEEHLNGREMSWLRIEPYYNDPNKPEFLPMMCQQCDHAPCESVCPVFATYHTEEGLNAQIYNRCVGTRYCANNCPYKVRRFNWADNKKSMPLYDQHNPDLLVRPAGVMEKCTFCIQRIRAAKDHAKDENRLVKDGEMQPACAQTCPTGAITFGNLMDPESKVSQLAKSQDVHQVLEEMGTRPAVYYIKRHDDDKKNEKKS